MGPSREIGCFLDSCRQRGELGDVRVDFELVKEGLTEIDRLQTQIYRLIAAQDTAVRILSAVEFDGQAYEAIQRACKLLDFWQGIK